MLQGLHLWRRKMCLQSWISQNQKTKAGKESSKEKQENDKKENDKEAAFTQLQCDCCSCFQDIKQVLVLKKLRIHHFLSKSVATMQLKCKITPLRFTTKPRVCASSKGAGTAPLKAENTPRNLNFAKSEFQNRKRKQQRKAGKGQKGKRQRSSYYRARLYLLQLFSVCLAGFSC